jgi:RNA polymerase sigma factor (sigma-70 family)
VHAPAIDAALVARLYAQSRAATWNISTERFEAALIASLVHAKAKSNDAATNAEQYLSALHLEDLALAVACASGHEDAWDHFVKEHRPLLQRAALAIDPANGAELADSLFSDLFSQSLFRYFHGRAKLSTWLRAVIAQRHVDRVRVMKREEPLPDDDAGPVAAGSQAANTDHARFLLALREALAAVTAALAPKDRLRMKLYYAQDMTLAAIGRMLGEHEATVSRQLSRTRKEIRLATEARLRTHHGFEDRTLIECLQSVSADAGELDLAEVFGLPSPRKNARADRSIG